MALADEEKRRNTRRVEVFTYVWHHHWILFVKPHRCVRLKRLTVLLSLLCGWQLTHENMYKSTGRGDNSQGSKTQNQTLVASV